MAKYECNQAIDSYRYIAISGSTPHPHLSPAPVAAGTADANFHGASASSPQRHCVAWWM